MKLLVVFALAVAYANADVSQTLQGRPPYPETLSFNNDADPEGNFQYSFETENGIKTAARGTVLNPGTDAEALQIEGQVQYTAPDGTPIGWTFVAGPNGYEAQGSHLPTPPPVPESVLRALAFIAANPPPLPAVALSSNAAKSSSG